MLKVWPARMIAAVRAGPAFGSTLNASVWAPVPVGGMPLIHVGTSLAVQVQRELVETATLPAPPPIVNDWPAGAIE
jgi:hypothetical protein